LIPVNEPWLGDAEVRMAARAVASGWISGQGEYVQEFEQRWAALCGRRHGISVSSGTAALETAIHALRLPRGSELIMPAFTMISCLAGVMRNGLVPVFVDADPRTWCMDVEQAAAKVTRRTSAVMAVHIYGHPVDMDPLLEVAEKHQLKVVEDAAEAHGAHYRGRVCGSFGDASAFSFYSNKIVATGEGGMVVCDDETVAEDCGNYRNLYFDRAYRFLHGRLGHNFRLTNVQAAIGCAQIDRLPEALRRKERMARLYGELLGGLPGLQLPPQSEDCDNVHWVYGVVLDDDHPLDAEGLQQALRERGVDSRRFFLGMHEQPVARDSGYGVGEGYPVTERLSRRGLYLPSGLALTEQQVEEVGAAMKACLEAVPA
jgi:perosamine synthetase